MTFALIAWTALLLGPEPVADDEKTAESAEPAPARVVDLELEGSIDEAPAPLGLDGTPIEDNLPTILGIIADAAEDVEVKALLLRFRNLAVGPGKAHELRRSIAKFRESGKPVVALLESASNADYRVASAADHVVMPESGSLMLAGLSAEVTFYKGLFDKVGIEAEILQVGEYKGAAEPFTRTELSPAFREELTDVLQDEFELLAEAIAESRDIEPEAAEDLINDGPYTPADALEAGLIDRLAYPDEVEAMLKELLKVDKIELDDEYGEPEAEDYSGFSGFMKLLQELSGQGEEAKESDAPKVAVIYATGVIQSGDSSPASLLGESVMGSDTIVAQIAKAEEDDTVKAIVLRVDSPGGSALASDLMWRSIVEAKKPIVASMSDTAASGGYYISMGCDAIFAEPGTLTGSIGVVGGKIALVGLFEKVGVTVDTVSVGKNGGLDSLVRPFTDDQEKAVRRMMEETYRQFVSKAADGRDMEYDALEALAGGRVYSGRRAKELGLVDELGTLEDAIDKAVALADLDPDVEIERLVLPEPKSIFEALSDAFDGTGLAAPSIGPIELLPAPIRAVAARADRLRRLLEHEPAAVVLPFEIQIR